MKKTDISITAGLLLAIILTFFADANVHATNIRRCTLRLHVIADDDSIRAQEMKIRVKDALTDICAELYCPADDYESAVEITENNLEYLQTIANHTLQQNGAAYTAACSIENFYFDTTQYSDFTLPRGEYTALTVRLGRAAGTNWWCVVYPSLCISAAAEYDDETNDAFITTEKFNIKFKTVEIWEELKRSFHHDTPLYTHTGQ
ncbi:MAG: stage II sporulation protein R [Oscillospiraceae bacterium]|nr:stage II sporulation protein R [Oscillospiraceae bacterium]